MFDVLSEREDLIVLISPLIIFIFHTLIYFPSCHWCLCCSNDVRHGHAAVPGRGLCWVSGPRTTPGLHPGHPTSAFTGILAECPGQPLLGLRLRLRLGLRACSVRWTRWVLYTRLAVVTLELMLLLYSTWNYHSHACKILCHVCGANFYFIITAIT